MYSWLVFLTCLSWLVFLSFRRAAGFRRCAAYGLVLAALAYSHPLGLFMIAAHGLAYILVRWSLKLGVMRWLAIQLAVGLAIVPWLGRYLSRGTDYPLPRYPIRFLLAVPIEYIGGNSLVLLVVGAIAGFGLLAGARLTGQRRFAVDNLAEKVVFLTWAAVPPVLMYVYSLRFQPIFGPSRYHLFSAPAYLVLVAHGLARLPGAVRWPAAAAGFALSISLFQVYHPSPKADWRGLEAWLSRRHPAGTAAEIAVVIHPGDPRFPREPLEAARYYLGPPFRVVPAGDTAEGTIAVGTTTYNVYCLEKPRRRTAGEPGSTAFDGLVVEARRPGSSTD
jgi:hypothetical protein